MSGISGTDRIPAAGSPRRSTHGVIHLVLCRNLVFTYFADPVQGHVSEQIATRLLPGGFFMIGKQRPFQRRCRVFCPVTAVSVYTGRSEAEPRPRDGQRFDAPALRSRRPRPRSATAIRQWRGSRSRCIGQHAKYEPHRRQTATAARDSSSRRKLPPGGTGFLSRYSTTCWNIGVTGGVIWRWNCRSALSASSHRAAVEDEIVGDVDPAAHRQT